MHRSSKMSHGKNQTLSNMQRSSYTRPTDEDPLENMARIHEMMATLDMMNGRNQMKTARTTRPPSPNLMHIKSSSKIINLPLRATFKIKTKLKPLATVEVAEETASPGIRVGGGRKGSNSSRMQESKRQSMPEPQPLLLDNAMLEAYYCPRFDEAESIEAVKYDALEVELQKYKEREENEALLANNNETIRQLLQQMALLVQRPDSEQRYLRKNVIQPQNLAKYNLRRFVGKTI